MYNHGIKHQPLYWFKGRLKTDVLQKMLFFTLFILIGCTFSNAAESNRYIIKMLLEEISDIYEISWF